MGLWVDVLCVAWSRWNRSRGFSSAGFSAGDAAERETLLGLGGLAAASTVSTVSTVSVVVPMLLVPREMAVVVVVVAVARYHGGGKNRGSRERRLEWNG